MKIDLFNSKFKSGVIIISIIIIFLEVFVLYYIVWKGKVNKYGAMKRTFQ